MWKGFLIMIEMKDLKNCQHCTSSYLHLRIRTITRFFPPARGYCVHCSACEADGPICDTRNYACKLWNHRNVERPANCDQIDFKHFWEDITAKIYLLLDPPQYPPKTEKCKNCGLVRRYIIKNEKYWEYTDSENSIEKELDEIPDDEYF